MNYCPNCGLKLVKEFINHRELKRCDSCTYIDWDNWVNVSCVVVAYNKENEIVMVKLKGKEKDKITFPGGYRDLGETLEEAARREFYEETGMQINKLELFRAYTKDEQRLVWVVYKTRIDEVSFVENEEVSELILVKEYKDIDKNKLRGALTEQLFDDLF